LREAVEGLALEQPPLPLTSVHRQVRQFALMIGEPCPSYWVIRDIVLNLPEDLRTLAHQGARRFGELYEMVTSSRSIKTERTVAGRSYGARHQVTSGWLMREALAYGRDR
jgi:hypothetical protein